MKQFVKTIKKNRLWIIAGILVVATGISLYNRLTKPASATPVNTATPSPSFSPTTELPSPRPSSEPTPTTSTIIEGAVRWADLDSTRQAIAFIDPVDQGLREIDLKTGTITTLGTLTEPTRAAVWSPNHRWLAIVTGEAGDSENNARIATYDIHNKKLYPLDPSITALSFLSDQKIIYQYQNEQSNTLAIANLDGSSWKAIDTPSSPVDIVWAGPTALTQPLGTSGITRYNQNGRSIETHRVPDDFRLTQSSWLDRDLQAIYWVIDNGVLSIKSLDPDGQTETLTTLDWEEELFSVLWDNSNGAIYIASDSGLIKLAVTAKL